MIAVAVNRECFEEIKNEITYKDAYFYTDERLGEQVEMDVEEKGFIDAMKAHNWKW